MKLNEKQLLQVKDYLKNKDVEYIDLHFEVLDHIASDIETKIEASNVNFESAFEEVKEKWNKTFSYKWSFWLGLTNGGSKLFIDHCLRIYKPILIKGLVSLFISIAVVTFFHKQIQTALAQFQIIAKYLFTMFSVLYLSLIYYWKSKINKAGKITSYYYLFKKTIMPNIAITALFVLQIFTYNKDLFDVKIFIFSTIFLFNLYSGFNFYRKHLKTLKKYNML